MHTLRNKLLFYGSAVCAGVVSLGLHRYMMETYVDGKGLLIAWNLPQILLLAVGGAFVLFVGKMTRTLGGDGTFEDNFPRDPLSGGLLVAAGLVLALALPGMSGESQPLELAGILASLPPVLEVVGGILPWLAAASMAALGVCRIRGCRTMPLAGGVVCLYYMVTLIDHYRLWSADPKIHTYGYQLLAGMLLMLSSFHRTCCDAGIIQRKKLILTGLGAAVCCVAALSMPFRQTFYLASALWGLGCICTPSVLPTDPEEEEAPEAPAAEE